jgi:phosphotriesterase-related protein
MIKSILQIFWIALILTQCTRIKEDGIIMTVNGPVVTNRMGVSLIHEHILVDFIGADSISEQRWIKSEVVKVVLPYLKEIKFLGCQTFVECTPAYLGRDPVLLKILSDSTGLNIITNTGYYGARNNKYLPSYALSETADQIAKRWIKEWEEGIDGTKIKPGFIKIGVDNDNLSETHKKLVIAAARTHIKTGLTIVSHTGSSVPAFEQLELLEKEGVAPEAFIWAHAQSEKNYNKHVIAAQKGAWISLDGMNDTNIEEYAKMIRNLKEHNLLGRTLLSHDAGWYRPGEQNGANYRGYTALFEKLIPLLRNEQFSKGEIQQLIVINPGKAFEVKVHLNKG